MTLEFQHTRFDKEDKEKSRKEREKCYQNWLRQYLEQRETQRRNKIREELARNNENPPSK